MIIMLMFIGAFAQKINEKDVPIGILNDLKTRYPSAEKVQWFKDNARFAAEFTNDGSKVRAEYENNYWFRTFWSIPLEYTPFKIKDYVAQYYAGFKIMKIDMLETNANERSYVVNVQKKKKDEFDLYFELTGTFLKKIDKNETKNDVKKVEEKKEPEKK